MLKRNYLGTTISFVLPENQYKGYVVDCTYKFIKHMNKYAVNMWLRRTDIDDRLQICSQGINTQYISSDKDHIQSDIGDMIEQAVNSTFFDEYVNRFEYTQKCFDYGNNHFEKITLRNSENGEYNL